MHFPGHCAVKNTRCAKLAYPALLGDEESAVSGRSRWTCFEHRQQVLRARQEGHMLMRVDWFGAWGKQITIGAAAKWCCRTSNAGEKFMYSNLQWAVVELAVERATGMDWPTAAKKFLFQPLGLSENTYYRSEDKPACYQMNDSSIYETWLLLGFHASVSSFWWSLPLCLFIQAGAT